MKNERATLLQGTLDLLILKALSTGQLHGLGVSRRIEQITGGTFAPQPGSLFPALHRLEEAGLLASSWDASENNRRAKYYNDDPRWSPSAGARNGILAANRDGDGPRFGGVR